MVETRYCGWAAANAAKTRANPSDLLNRENKKYSFFLKKKKKKKDKKANRTNEGGSKRGHFSFREMALPFFPPKRFEPRAKRPDVRCSECSLLCGI